MKNFEEIKKLRQNANNIYQLFNQDIPKWQKDPKHFDKTGCGFNEDDRFRASEPVSIWFSSWEGTYGNSGCSSKLSLDKHIFGLHLLRYLNKNKKEIMCLIAESINAEAKKLKEAAEGEVSKQLEYLKELETL